MPPSPPPLALRPGCLPWVGRAEKGPADSTVRLVASPCNMRAPVTWHIGVFLDEEGAATARGLRNTEFNLSVYLEDASLAADGGAVAPRGGDGVPPAAGAAGDGFVCCGGFKLHLAPQVPPEP